MVYVSFLFAEYRVDDDVADFSLDAIACCRNAGLPCKLLFCFGNPKRPFPRE